MIYQFEVILFESHKMQIEIEIDAMQSFLDLHKALQDSLGIPQCQMASFFISDSAGKNKSEVSQVDMGTVIAPCHYMRRTRVADLISPEKPLLYYTFDLFNDRTLFMELTGINMEKNLREPRVRINGIDSQIHMLEEIIGDEFSMETEKKQISSDYGVTEDYYEIFGDIEELTV
jgi:hypothetical protein